jgi:hypothetical protein
MVNSKKQTIATLYNLWDDWDSPCKPLKRNEAGFGSPGAKSLMRLSCGITSLSARPLQADPGETPKTLI